MTKSSKAKNKILNQQKITGPWFSKYNGGVEINRSKTSEKASDEPYKFKSPKNVVAKANNKTIEQSKQINKENDSDDSEIIANSQNTNESELRKKIKKTALGKCQTPKSTPKKDKILTSPGSVIDRLSITESEICDIYNNIADKEPIEMTHDIDALITNDKVPTESLEHLKSIDESKVKLLSDKDTSKEDNIKYSLRAKRKKINYNIESSSPEKKRKKGSSEESFDTSEEDYTETSDDEENKKGSPTNKPSNEKVLSKSLMEQLKKMEIKLIHEVRPQHQIECSAGTQSLTANQRKAFEKFGPLKIGAYSTSEDEIIKKNWEDFCFNHNWDKEIVEPFIRPRIGKGVCYIPCLITRIKFVQFLANGLPWRSLHSVMNRFKCLYDNAKTGSYSAKEDKIIWKRLSKLSPTEMTNQIALLAKELNRKRISLWQHYQQLKKLHNVTNSISNSHTVVKNKNSKRRRGQISSENKVSNVGWTYPVVKKFLYTLQRVTKCKNLEELKNQTIDDDVWKKIEKLTNIECSVLQNFWYLQLHMQLFCPNSIYLNDLIIQLIEYLYDQKEVLEDSHWDIDWEAICLDFEGLTSLFLSQLFDHLNDHAKLKIDSDNISDKMEYLYSNYIPELMDKTNDAVLPKLDFKLRYLNKIKEKKISSKTLDTLFEEIRDS